MKIGNVKVHGKNQCEPPCPFHSPSDHPLKDAEMHIRTDKHFLVERICKHGVGHDDPDSVKYMLKQGHSWAGLHGCDGCCEKPVYKEQKTSFDMLVDNFLDNWTPLMDEQIEKRKREELMEICEKYLERSK